MGSRTSSAGGSFRRNTNFQSDSKWFTRTGDEIATAVSCSDFAGGGCTAETDFAEIRGTNEYKSGQDIWVRWAEWGYCTGV